MSDVKVILLTVTIFVVLALMSYGFERLLSGKDDE